MVPRALRGRMSVGVAWSPATWLVFGLLLLPVLATSPGRADEAPVASVGGYPTARRGDSVDLYHSIRVTDPYRWLEDPASRESQAWLTAQKQFTNDFLARLPARETLRRRLTVLWNFQRCGLPEMGGETLYFQRVDGLQNQPVLYAQGSADASPRPLVNPNALDPSGATSICGWSVSPDGRWLAYALSVAGSDQHAWRVRDLRAGRDLAETLATTLHAEIVWSPRSDGFYYARSNIPPHDPAVKSPPERILRVKFHRVGEDPRRDRALYERAALRDSMCDVRLSDDGRWLVVRVWNGLERDRRVFCLDTQAARPQPQWVVSSTSAHFQFVGEVGAEFYFQTDHEAPRGKVVGIDRRRVEPQHWRTIVAESTDTLVETTLVDQRLFLRGLREAATVVRVFDLAGEPRGEVDLPAAGTVTGFRGRPGQHATYYSLTSYTQPPRVFRYEPDLGRSSEFQPPQLTFDPALYSTELVHYAGQDGTRIPMMITRRQDRAAAENAPVLLYGYGGFHIPLTPSFSLTHLAWLDLGGILAVPNIRGGGEFGRPWHDAAKGANKGVAVDDFLAAARWLIEQRYTSADRLVIRGVSNGGLVVGSALARHPELFAAAIPTVAPLDMLRYHRLPRGWAWISEYGTVEQPDQFRALLDYSPLHNLRVQTRYPATLIMTSEQDDRVVPAHSFKFAAALQAAQSGPAPCLIRVESQAGHGAGLSTPKLIEASADMLAFLCYVLQLPP